MFQIFLKLRVNPLQRGGNKLTYFTLPSSDESGMSDCVKDKTVFTYILDIGTMLTQFLYYLER